MNILGIYFDLIIYTVIFIILIPTILYKFKYFTILEAYMPNLDLIAAILTFNNLSFNKLYIPKITSIHENISQLYVNYFALLGVAYIVIKRALSKKNIHYGLSVACIMLFLTFISPNIYLARSMRYIESISSNAIATIFGIILVICVIIFEKNIIAHFHEPLSKIIKSLLSVM